jgi:hypothetical protein
MKNIRQSCLEPTILGTLSEGARDGMPRLENPARLPFDDVAYPGRTRNAFLHDQIGASKVLVREYFRSIRAAEMAAWEMTGGDCVQSRFIKASRSASSKSR